MFRLTFNRLLAFSALLCLSFWLLLPVRDMAFEDPESVQHPHTSKYPKGVPKKFSPEGTVQAFPGNTIVSHLSPDSPLYASMLVLHEKLRVHRLSHLYTLLPPPSWHMTVYEGVCDQVRKPGYWPADLAIDAPLADCNALFSRKLEVFDLQYAPPYRMAVTGWSPINTGISVRVKPRTEEDNTRLRGLRDRLADKLQTRHKGHESYRLHLSLLYMLRYLTDGQKKELQTLLDEHFENMPKEFELGAPEFCKFDDMFEFKRLFYLKDQV